MKIFLSKLGAVITAFALTASVATADPPIPITADQAFDAVQMQIDPETGMAASVALIDVRDPVEYFFTGAPAEVTKIVLIDGEKEIFADLGKVRLLHEGKFIEYRVNGRYKRTLVDKVSRIETQALALNIPFWLRTPTGWDKTTETAFQAAVEELAPYYDVLVLFCRTGGRSSLAGDGIDPMLFTVYEIDDPDGSNGSGGFSGPVYGSAFNGYPGFPGRLTDGRETPSVSWLDSGLPVVTTALPISPTE